MREASGHVKGLNGARAVAVTLVFLAHKGHVEIVDVGQLGVWLFFLISGFLIIGELHRNRIRIEAARETRDAAMCVFFMKRGLRIFPVYYLLLVALAIAHRFFYQRDVDLGLPWHFFYLSDYWIGFVHDGWAGTVSHFWSLAVEQQFYLAAPFVLLFSRASRHAALCAAFVVFAGAVHIALDAHGASPPLVYACSPWNFALIALGGMSAILCAQGHRAARVAGAAPVLGLGIAGVAAILAWRAGAAGTRVEGAVAGWLDIGLAFSLLAVFLSIVNRQDSRLVAVLETRPLNYLGTVSYGFYLFHNLIPSRLGEAPRWYARFHVPHGVQVALPVALQFLVALLLADLSWRLFEKRLLEWKKPFEAAIRSRLAMRAAVDWRKR
jgi:peptidoglycan/LPS O-acetylase OafA/YrhL